MCGSARSADWSSSHSQLDNLHLHLHPHQASTLLNSASLYFLDVETEKIIVETDIDNQLQIAKGEYKDYLVG